MKGRDFAQRKERKKTPKMAELINPPITLVCLFSKKRAAGHSLGEDLLALMALRVRLLHPLCVDDAGLCAGSILCSALRSNNLTHNYEGRKRRSVYGS